MWGIILGMVVVWSVAMLSRNTIRAYWWSHRLAVSETPNERLLYFRRLADLGDTAVPAVAKLLSKSDPGLRSFAVGVLHHAHSDRARELLQQACQDADEDVARLAMQGIAMRRNGIALQSLADIARAGNERRAMMATAAISELGTADARKLLLDLLESTKQTAVRVEAIECLGNLQVHEAVESLIDLLGDASVFEGTTEHGVMASRAFQAVQLHNAEDLVGGEAPALLVEKYHVVWKCAHQALSAITGHTPILDTTQEADQQTIAAAWREWRRQTKSGGDSAIP